MEQSEQPSQTVPPVMPEQTVPPQVTEYPRPHAQPVAPTDDPMRFVIPMNPSALAVIAGYVGMFSVLAIPAPIAIILGVLALKDIKRNPSKTGRGRAIFAIVVGAFFTVLFAIIIISSIMSPAKSV